jgi:hypothetical protein
MSLIQVEEAPFLENVTEEEETDILELHIN